VSVSSVPRRVEPCRPRMSMGHGYGPLASVRLWIRGGPRESDGPATLPSPRPRVREVCAPNLPCHRPPRPAATVSRRGFGVFFTRATGSDLVVIVGHRLCSALLTALVALHLPLADSFRGNSASPHDRCPSARGTSTPLTARRREDLRLDDHGLATKPTDRSEYLVDAHAVSPSLQGLDSSEVRSRRRAHADPPHPSGLNDPRQRHKSRNSIVGVNGPRSVDSRIWDAVSIVMSDGVSWSSGNYQIRGRVGHRSEPLHALHLPSEGRHKQPTRLPAARANDGPLYREAIDHRLVVARIQRLSH